MNSVIRKWVLGSRQDQGPSGKRRTTAVPASDAPLRACLCRQDRLRIQVVLPGRVALLR